MPDKKKGPITVLEEYVTVFFLFNVLIFTFEVFFKICLFFMKINILLQAVILILILLKTKVGL